MNSLKQISSLPFSKQFKISLIWNLFDSIGSQGLVIIYHLLFRTFAGQALHGIMGCMLSVLYLAVVICNFGLDASLAPFLHSFTKNKASFSSAVKRFFIPQALLIIVLGFVAYATFPFLSEHISLFKTFAGHITPYETALFCLSFVLESVRKIARTFLQLTFYTRLTALVEIVSTAAYLIALLMAFIFGKISLLITWELFALSAFIQVSILCYGLYALYQTLDNEGNSELPSLSRVGRTRFFAWGNQCLNQFYSSNFLVPLCAIYFGIESASLMKVVSSIAHWLKLIAQRVFGVSSNALLAHLKSRSLDTQTVAFNYLASLSNQTLYGLLIFLLINGRKLALAQMSTTFSINWSILYLVLILTFFESFFVLYEKWYIFEESAFTFFLFNFVSFIFIYGTVSSLSNPLLIFMSIIVLRLLTFIALTLFSFYRWKILPSFKPNVKILAFGFLLSGICYFFL